MAFMVTANLPEKTDVASDKETSAEREESIRMSYIAFVINEFPEAFKMGKPEGYQYLKKYGGLDYICEHWWALHIDNQRHVMQQIFDICKENGGDL
jgi:hypothetical protein